MPPVVEPVVHSSTPSSVIPPASPKKGHTPIGPVIGTIIVTLILIAGGLYLWGAKLNATPQDPPPFIPSNDTTVEGDPIGTAN